MPVYCKKNTEKVNSRATSLSVRLIEYMRFSEWVLTESNIEVPANTQLPLLIKAGGDVVEYATTKKIQDILHTILRRYFNRIDSNGWRFAKDRYKFKLTNIRNESDYFSLKLQIDSITRKRGEDEVIPPGDPSYDYYQKYGGGKTGAKIFKTPKEAIEDIEPDAKMAYRGVAWEEWQYIQSTGHIMSLGSHNLGGQEGWTLFGYEPRTALAYAHGFAPIQYMSSSRKPGVVFSVPRSLLKTHKEAPKAVPNSELGHEGPLSSRAIKSAWMLTPRSIKPGDVEFIIPVVPAWDYKRNSRNDPMNGFFKLDVDQVKIGSGAMYTVRGYAIRKMF